MPNSTRTTAVVVVLTAFVAGLVAGVGGELVYLIHNHRIVPTHTAGTKHLIDRLDHELKLDPQQRARIETIVEARRQRIDAIWSSARPAVMQEIDATNAEIDKVLNPDQRVKFKALQARMRNRVHGGPGHHGQMPPPPPPGG